MQLHLDKELNRYFHSRM